VNRKIAALEKDAARLAQCLSDTMSALSALRADIAALKASPVTTEDSPPDPEEGGGPGH
jgi:hypothetical protein